VVPHGELRRVRNAEALERAATQEGKSLSSASRKVVVAQITAEVAVAAVAVGRDGRTYFLVRAGEGGGLALERYDPIALAVERIELPFALPGMGATMASSSVAKTSTGTS
jgi:hypothetical protein